MHPARCRVLYVDDHEDTCHLMRLFLGHENFDVTTAETAAEALRLARSKEFDAYVLDQRLPDATGVELCRQLLVLTPGTPVIFYSAAAFEKDRQRAIEAGAQAYLAKPDFEELAETISRLIKEAQEGQHLLTMCTP